VIATPTIQTKDGKTVSVSVQPCQSEWRSCAYASRSLPLLFTMIMNAITAPRNASSETSRCVAGIGSFAGEAAVRVSYGLAFPGATLGRFRQIEEELLAAGR
jgi:hypothetical protein